MTKNDLALLIKRQADAWQRADVEAIIADFAENAIFASPGGRWQGKKAIADVAEEFFSTCSQIQIEVKRILLDGNQGAVEWIWHETRKADGKTYTMEDAIIFELLEGKILYWREYFKPE